MLKATKNDPDLPGLKEALAGPHRHEFIDAIKQEIEEVEKLGTWNVVKRSKVPEGANILQCTWVLRIKRYLDGRLRKFKARICARGDQQVEGIDYDESFAPVVSWGTVRLFLCLSAKMGWATRQVDFSNAFVQAYLTEEVYMRFPPLFGDPTAEE